MGTLAARFERLTPVLSQETWNVEAATLVVLMGLHAFLLVSVVAIAASVYLPRNPRTGGSLIYYEDISVMPFESFRDQAEAMTTKEVERQLLHQIHTVSGIASVKMRRVGLAYYLSIPSVALWVILLAWGSL